MYEEEIEALTPRPLLFLEKALVGWWWVAALAMACFLLYEAGLRRHAADFEMLQEQLTSLQQEKSRSLAQQLELLASVNSQSDPDYIELTLKKELGLVPEGSVKVFFK